MKLETKKGFITFRQVGKPKHGLFELERIEVPEIFQREGEGTKLFNMMIEKINPYRKLFCTTHASNKKAHKFYEAVGMKMEAVLSNHYYKEESEIVYSLYS